MRRRRYVQKHGTPGPTRAEERALIAAAQERVVVGGKPRATPAAQRAQAAILAQWKAGLRAVAVRYSKYIGGASAEDLFQEASMGLLHAVSRFDLKRPWRLWTFAYPWVVAYARNAVMRSPLISITTTQADRMLFWRAAKVERVVSAQGGDRRALVEALKTDLFRPPKRGKSKEWRKSDEKVVQEFLLKRFQTTTRSLDAPIRPSGEEDYSALIDTVAGKGTPIDELLETRERFAVLACAVERLYRAGTQRDRAILKRILAEDRKKRTLHDIGREFGVSRERIRQIEAKLIEKLKAEYHRCEGEA